jgi:cardiolipin synthase
MGLPRLLPGHQLALLENGTSFFPELERAIDSSQHEVRLETYIFHFDASGERVARALVRAARRGVSVYVVMDAIGTAPLPDGWANQFDEAGVQWHRFSPLGALGLVLPIRWRRLHRKLCVVDARVAFCGGINVVDDHVDPGQGRLSYGRFDFSVRVTGPVVQHMWNTMAQFWSRLLVSRRLGRLQFQDAGRLWLQQKQLSTASMAQLDTAVDGAGGLMVALVLRDNVKNRLGIERVYRKAIGEAKSEVLIANAYFLPGTKLLRALMHAAGRGVRVRLLLHGTYESFLQYHASRPLFYGLLAAGVEIHEYRTGFLHAKVAVVDGCWATVGSSNLDPLSLLLAREANVVIDDQAFAVDLRSRILQGMDKHGVELNLQRYGLRPWHQRVLDYLALGVVRMLLFVTGRRY